MKNQGGDFIPGVQLQRILEALVDTMRLLESHEDSAYCQCWSKEEDVLIQRVKSMPEVVSYLAKEEAMFKEKFAIREGRFCAKCRKIFQNPRGLKQHIRNSKKHEG